MEDTAINIQDFHKYRFLVKEGKAKPLLCPVCEYEYILRATEDGDPVLQCMTCSTMTQPGLNLYSTVRAVVTEHFA